MEDIEDSCFGLKLRALGSHCGILSTGLMAYFQSGKEKKKRRKENSHHVWLGCREYTDRVQRWT